MEDSSFIETEDPETLKRLVNEFKGSMIESGIKQWMDIWFSFDKGERSRRSSLLIHQWFTCQSELCSNIIYKHRGYFDKVYDKLQEKHHRIGLPYRLCKVFDLYNRFLEALSEVDSRQLNDTSTKYTQMLITEKGKRIA